MAMSKLYFAVFFLAATTATRAAITNLNAWTPLFRGIDYTFAQVLTTTNRERNDAITSLRIDLTDPDLSLFTTPHCTNGCTRDTANQNTSHFLETYGLQVAVN